MPKVKFKVGDEVKLKTRKELKAFYKKMGDVEIYRNEYSKKGGTNQDLLLKKLVVMGVQEVNVPKDYFEFCVDLQLDGEEVVPAMDPRELTLWKNTLSLKEVYNEPPEDL